MLRSDDYADVYGAMSLALAFTLSALLTFLIQGGIYLSVRRQLADLARRDTSRMRESLSVSGKIFSRSVLTYLPSQALVGCFFSVQYLIWLLGQKNAEEVPHVSGALLVEYFFPFLLFLLMFGMTVVRSVSETPAMVKREDYVRLNQSILDNRHSLALTALPLSVLLCVLAEPFSRVLFAEQNRELLGIWKVAGIVVYLGVLAIYQIQVCREAGMLLECNLICLAGFIVGIAGFGILEREIIWAFWHFRYRCCYVLEFCYWQVDFYFIADSGWKRNIFGAFCIPWRLRQCQEFSSLLQTRHWEKQLEIWQFYLSEWVWEF